MNPKPYRMTCAMNGCTSTEFKPLKMKQKTLNVVQCNKCKNTIDLSARGEDIKHQVYHETGKEPKDKSGITEERKR